MIEERIRCDLYLFSHPIRRGCIRANARPLRPRMPGRIRQSIFGRDGGARSLASLPVTPDVKFSEDDVPLKLGEAFWKTASGIGKYKLYFADPQAGQVGFMGTMKENGRGVALVMRLKVENGRISEAEQLVLRSEATAATLRRLARRTRC